MEVPSCSTVLGADDSLFPFPPRRSMQKKYVDGVDPEVYYSLSASKAEKLNTHFGDIYSALSAFKELVLDTMI